MSEPIEPETDPVPETTTEGGGGETAGEPSPEEGEPSRAPAVQSEFQGPPVPESPLNPDGVDPARPVDRCNESGGAEPAPAEEQDYEVARLAEFNAVLSPILAAAMRATLDTMGIQGIPAIGSAVGMVVHPYLEQMREVNAYNAPRQIAEWFDACVNIAEYVQNIRNGQAGRIIVP